MAGVKQQIIGSFEDIGKDIVRETSKVPSDILGKVIESIGTSSQSSSRTSASALPGDRKPDSAASALDQAPDQQAKKAIARRALEELAKKSTQKEPTIWEKIQQEAKEKKDAQEYQRKKQSLDSLPVIKGAKKRGDLFGIAAKKQGSEIGKNARQD